jgi:hypothetical protein
MQEISHGLLGADEASIKRGQVAAILADAVVVTLAERGPQACDVLETAAGSPSLAEGDAVLVWLPADGRERAVVLGRIGAPSRPAVASDNGEVVIQAKRQLTLRCGDGSVTMRDDGKVLVKGKDLVSHAKRVNRIRGGSVQIN